MLGAGLPGEVSQPVASLQPIRLAYVLTYTLSCQNLLCSHSHKLS